jgi:hypothetical protein
MAPQAITDAVGFLEADGFPRVFAAPGFVTMFFGINLADGKGVGVTFWESDVAMRISDEIEAPVRDEALRLAHADRSKGIQDTYRIVLCDLRPTGPGPVHGRLTRWMGIQPEPLREALTDFMGRRLPRFQDLRGYRGMVLGENTILGNTFGVSLWQNHDIDAFAAEEREAIKSAETRTGVSLRPVIVDSYDVVVVPDMPSFAAVA